jgi:flagellin-like hook-associated protein FlgL
MFGIRQDGIAVKLPTAIYTTKEGAAEFAQKNQFLAVLFNGNYIFAGKDPFTKQMGNLRVLQSIPEKALLFTENDASVKDSPFYLRGLFGIDSKKGLYTKLYSQEFTAASGNVFNIFIRGEDIVFLSVDSPNDLTFVDVKNDAITLAAETHGLGKSVGLIITRNCTGYFNLKQ